MTAEKSLDLWAAVCKTDPRFTKRVNQKGGFTSICAQSQIMAATQQWGPYGAAWGLRNIVMDFDSLRAAGTLVYRAEFYCPDASFVLHNSIQYMQRDHRIDDDFAKKIETDTLTKALSRLGFNADVFLGLFDDQRYVDARYHAVLAEEQRAAGYPAETFAKNLTQWRAAIESGKTTADQLIAKISTKGTLTDEQKQAINGVVA